MGDAPDIYVISRPIDTERRAWIEEQYAMSGLNFTFLDAVNGHDMDELRPFANLIADRFWNGDSVKVGALGAFFSHYRAWQIAVQKNKPIIVSEDDSAPNIDAKTMLENLPDDTELVFVNDRLARWTRPNDGEYLSMAGLASSLAKRFANAPARAPGADGYLVTPKAAQRLIELTHQWGTICGVDWFMVAMSIAIGEIANPEINTIFHQIGGHDPQLKAYIKRTPVFENTGHFPSVLLHKDQRPIAQLKQSLEGDSV